MTVFIPPPRVALPPNTLATGFSYRLLNSRVTVVLKNGLSQVYFRRLLTRAEAAEVGPAWADRVQIIRISLSIMALNCLTHFADHLAVDKQQPGVEEPTLLFRRIPTIAKPLTA